MRDRWRFRGSAFCLYSVTSSPCEVTSFTMRIVASPPGERPSIAPNGDHGLFIVERLRKGGSVVVEVCGTPSADCGPGEGIVCSARLSLFRDDLRLENNYDVDQLVTPGGVPGKLLVWNFATEGLHVAYVKSTDVPPQSPPGAFDVFPPASIDGFRIYASPTSGFVPSPANLAMEINSGDVRSVLLDPSSRTDFYRVTPVRNGSEEGPPSNEVGGPLADITSVVLQGQKLVVNGTGFGPATRFSLGSFELVPPPKFKNEGTKVIQKLRFPVSGLTAGELVGAGESASVFVFLGGENYLMFPY